MINFILEAIKVASVIVIFQYIIPPIIHSLTGNSWRKLPVFIVLGLLAGGFIFLINASVLLVLIFWFFSNIKFLAEISRPSFQMAYGKEIKLSIFALSSFACIAVASVFVLYLQGNIVVASNAEKQNEVISSDRDYNLNDFKTGKKVKFIQHMDNGKSIFAKFDSTAIDIIAWGVTEKRLIVIFVDSNKYYFYEQVPKHIVQGLLSASSTGKYFNQYVKGKYKYRSFTKEQMKNSN